MQNSINRRLIQPTNSTDLCWPETYRSTSMLLLSLFAVFNADTNSVCARIDSRPVIAGSTCDWQHGNLLSATNYPPPPKTNLLPAISRESVRSATKKTIQKKALENNLSTSVGSTSGFVWSTTASQTTGCQYGDACEYGLHHQAASEWQRGQ